MKDSTLEEKCPKCNEVAMRHYLPTRGFIKGFEPGYFPALGKYFGTQTDLKYHLDKHNLVPIGNDFGSGEKMFDTFERDRQINLEKKYKRELEKI